MRFRTEYQPRKADFTLSPDKPAILTGSCFSDNISARMRGCLWKARNPFGALYNPLSIATGIRMALSPDMFINDFGNSLFFTDDRKICHSWCFDSKMSGRTHAECSARFLESSKIFTTILEEGRTLMITFGTSNCYFLSECPGFTVANCHKQPAAMFIRRRITVNEIKDVWDPLIELLEERYPGLRIIFTVSPIRHLKDGFEENQLSKATLLLAVDDLCRNNEICSYFPAYEIVNDDLRDYRFYASDLAHPSETAVDYIWHIFKATYLDNAGMATLKEGEGILRQLAHRPLIPESPEEKHERLALITSRYAHFRSLHPLADTLNVP